MNIQRQKIENIGPVKKINRTIKDAKYTVNTNQTSTQKAYLVAIDINKPAICIFKKKSL